MAPIWSLMALAAETSWSRETMPAETAARTVSMSSVPAIWSFSVEASTPCSRESATVSGRLMALASAPSSARSASLPW